MAKRKQVKNACSNCQRACKKCDDSRPCLRCSKYGMQDSCVNSTRKERRPGAPHVYAMIETKEDMDSDGLLSEPLRSMHSNTEHSNRDSFGILRRDKNRPIRSAALLQTGIREDVSGLSTAEQLLSPSKSQEVSRRSNDDDRMLNAKIGHEILLRVLRNQNSQGGMAVVLEKDKGSILGLSAVCSELLHSEIHTLYPSKQFIKMKIPPATHTDHSRENLEKEKSAFSFGHTVPTPPDTPVSQKMAYTHSRVSDIDLNVNNGEELRPLDEQHILHFPRPTSMASHIFKHD